MSLVCLSIAGALYARIETAEFSLRLPQQDGSVVEEFHDAASDEPVVVPHRRGGPYAAICADAGPCITLDRLIPPRLSGAPVTVAGCGAD
jgi:hypothetical protein